MNHRKKYWEMLAKISLEKYFGFFEKELELVDKPDIQSRDRKFGIEVVLDVVQNEMWAQDLVSKAWKKHYEKLSKNDIITLENLGVCLILDDDKNVIKAIFPEAPNSSENLINTICHKIDLLNKGDYEQCEEYDLYVFTDTFLLEVGGAYIWKIIEDIHDYNENFERKYKRVYLDQLYLLYECNIESKEHRLFKLSRKQFDERQRVMNKLCQD